LRLHSGGGLRGGLELAASSRALSCATAPRIRAIPANTCEICSSNQNKFGWTPLPDNYFCDEMQLTLCCNGSCCNPGESCIGGGCQPN
jgi:hypothetical protein